MPKSRPHIRKPSPYPRGVEVVVGAFIENATGELFFARSPKWHNCWVIPGGHIDPGETIFAAARREVREETGLRVKPIAVLRTGEAITRTDFHRPIHLIFIHILCVVVGGSVRLDGRELTQAVWAKPRAAQRLKLGSPTIRPTLKAYLNYRTPRS